MYNPKRAKKRLVNIGTISFLFAISWVILGQNKMSVSFIPPNVWFWLNTIVGYGGIIFAVVLIFRNKVKFTDDDCNESIKELSNNIARLIAEVREAKSDKEEIKTIAYQIWEANGKQFGYDIEHWLKAKAIWEKNKKNKQIGNNQYVDF